MSKIASSVFALLFIVRLWNNSNKNITDSIKIRYGLNGLKSFRTYEQCLTKLEKTKLDLRFLETCKVYK